MAKSPNGKPPVVGKKEYEAARAYFRKKAEREGWDFDKFEREVADPNLLDKPIGPTEDCLSINTLSDYMSSERDTLMERDRVTEIMQHLGICTDCAEIVELLVSLKAESQIE